MKIFITGANGFIGAYITSSLINDGHDIICAVRDTVRAKSMFPSSKVDYCNFNTDDSKEIWINRLKGVDLVINIVGILQTNKKDSAKKIHELSTISLFEACVVQKVKKIIHISALGINKTDTEYSKTKLAADNYLQHLDIDWIVLRPSLIYASNSFGGTSLLRGLSILPMIPLIGIALLFRYKTYVIYLSQIIIISLYTCVLTIYLPTLWLDPLGPLVKNIPIIFLLLILLSIERDK